MAKARGNLPELKLALVGAETLLGKEITEVLDNRLPSATLAAFSSSGEGNFAEEDGEAVYVEPLSEASLAGTKAIISAGSKGGATKAYSLLRTLSHVSVIDCTGALEAEGEARIVAPLLKRGFDGRSRLFVIAHPVASALALVLLRLSRLGQIRGSLVHIFEPASERGKGGINELHQQTTGILAFKSLKRNVFDAQLSFNLLPRYGEEAPVSLAEVEGRIERHTASLLNDSSNLAAVPMPSIRLVQAPVFHGYSLSLWVEFESTVSVDSLSEALASAQIEVRGKEDEAPDNVGATSQSGLIAGDIRIDRNNGRSAWFWVVGDNLRLTADAVADLLTELQVPVQ